MVNTSIENTENLLNLINKTDQVKADVQFASTTVLTPRLAGAIIAAMSDEKSPCTPAPGGVYIEVKAKPRSAKPGVGPVEDGALVVRVGAAPTDGEANGELIKALAKAFGVARSAVNIARGEGSRHKRVLVKCEDPASVEAKVMELKG